MKTGWVWGAALVGALGLAGCGDDSNGSSSAAAQCTPPATPTTFFAQDVYPTLTAQCTPCHNDAQSARPKFASLDPSVSYSAVRSEVDTANPAQSPLLVRANGGSGHPDQLSDVQTATITKWIQECAQNNSRDVTPTTTQ